MLDLISLIKTGGYLGIFLVVMSESGILLGLFFPGDSLLFTAGFLASQGYLSLPFLILTTFIAAVFGDNIGYSFGFKLGPKIFTKEDSRFFNKDYLETAQAFYEKYGSLAIILARFTPVVRTLAPILAGVGKMRYSKFLTFNIVGGLFWSLGITSFGFYLGRVIPDVDKYLLPIILMIIFFSILPTVVHMLGKRIGQKDN